MQKISCYLYPNRINVVADMAVFPVRYKIVYQNRIKIYKGVDNILTIDVKNSDQKRIDITSMDLKISIQDANGKEFLNKSLTASATTGLATVNIEEDDIDFLDPQFLTFTVYKVNVDTSKTVFYADTQFGIKGNMELLDNAINIDTKDRFITRFNPITYIDPQPQYTIWYSDAVEIRKPNYLDIVTNDTFDLDILFSGLEGTVVVEYTNETVIAANIQWNQLESFSVTPATTSLTKTYSNPDYNRDANWLRIHYQPITGNTGKIDKAVVKL